MAGAFAQWAPTEAADRQAVAIARKHDRPILSNTDFLHLHRGLGCGVQVGPDLGHACAAQQRVSKELKLLQKCLRQGKAGFLVDA
jgi:hypothetical protein